MHSFAWWPTVVVLAIATITDLRSRRIPNWLVLPFLVAGIGVSGWFHGWHGVGQSFEGLGLGALIYGILAWKGGMGMGDVKLVAGIGAWIGPEQLMVALVIAAMAGGIIILGWALWRFLQSKVFGSGVLSSGNGKGSLRPQPDLSFGELLSRKMPYAPAIAVGTLISFFSSSH